MDASLLAYYAKWVEVLSNSLFIFYLWTSAGDSAAHHHLFSFLLLSRRPDLTILCMLLLCLSFLPLIQDAFPPVVSMNIFNSSTSKLVTSVEISRAPSSSYPISFHGCCSFFSFVRIKRMVQKGDILGAVGNIRSIVFFAQRKVSMELNPRMEVLL